MFLGSIRRILVSVCAHNFELVFFFWCRYGTIMFLILVLLKIKVAKIGFPETKISLNFQEVVHNLYTGQMSTWTILLRLLTILSFIIC